MTKAERLDRLQTQYRAAYVALEQAAVAGRMTLEEALVRVAMLSCKYGAAKALIEVEDRIA